MNQAEFNQYCSQFKQQTKPMNIIQNVSNLQMSRNIQAMQKKYGDYMNLHDLMNKQLCHQQSQRPVIVNFPYV